VVNCVKTIDTHLKHVIGQVAARKKADPEFPEAILVLNMTDKLKDIRKEARVPVMHRFQHHIPDLLDIFSEFFAISALTGDKVQLLQDWLMRRAKPGEWLYHHDIKTLRSPLHQAEEIIREKIFLRTNFETPYLVRLANVGWQRLADGTIRIDEDILVPAGNYVVRASR